MASNFKMDYSGVAELLKSKQLVVAVHKAAEAIAANVDKGSVTEAEVIVTDYITDRAHSVVVIAHPAGLAMEAKHGTLRKAAAAAGFEIKSKK
ncbi:MAG TPA: hypothetical protein DDY88_03750 [Actinobacteria bacterium]|nr:hypothetical protein [Actinomycetota bacterium]